MVALPTLTLRRFMVLVRGLSPVSATLTTLRLARELGEQNVIEANTEEEVMAGRAAIMGPLPQGRAAH